MLPSKLFEYGATNIPVIAGVNGYAREFMGNYMKNDFVFDPGNSHQLCMYLQGHSYKLERRALFVNKFQRKNITGEIAKSVILYLKKG